MSSRVRFTLVAGVGAGGAALWAVCLAVLEPSTELTRSVGAYWVRDLRWAALFAAVASLVTAARGNLPRSAAAALGAIGWAVVDVRLDRADVHGAGAAIGLAALGVAVTVGGCLAVRAGRGRPRRWPIHLVTALAGALSAAAALTRPPTESEPQLDPIGWAAAIVLALAALAAAASVSTLPRAGRRWLLGVLIVAAVGVPGLLRLVPVNRSLGSAFGWGWLLLTGLAVLSWGWAWAADGPGGRARRLVLLAVLDLVVFDIASFAALYAELSMPPDQALAALTGKQVAPPIERGVLNTGLALAAGLAVSVLWAILRLALIHRTPRRPWWWRRPGPSAPAAPAEAARSSSRS